MFNIRIALQSDLNAAALSHMQAFPDSFTTKLGLNFNTIAMGWFLSQPDRRMLWVCTHNDKTIGYLSAMVDDDKTLVGSTSGMIQYAFKPALKALISRPWLAFNKEFTKRYRLLWKNLLRGINGKRNSTPSSTSNQKKKIIPSLGVVGVGVIPEYLGKGVGSLLLQVFESEARKLDLQRLTLSVKLENTRAIKAYERNGWHISETKLDSYFMVKNLG